MVQTAATADAVLFDTGKADVPLGHALGKSVAVFVNHGRWIVQCPTCRSAQIAAKSDRRFFCIECDNIVDDKQWLTVDWPADPDAIEAELGKRPDPNTQGWHPGETVEDLARENTEHGVA